MPKILVTVKRFPPVNQWALADEFIEVDIDLDELLHAAITVGHPDYFTVLGGGQVAVAYEMMWKMASTMMALRAVHHFGYSYFTMTDRLKKLDPSEKRGATYQLGLTINKLLAWRLFGVRWLRHVDVYGKEFVPPLGGGHSRPDLFGTDDQGQYYVFESKGRLSVPTPGDIKKAKDQAGRISSISGATPVLAAASLAYFRKRRHRSFPSLECHLEDPPVGEQDDHEIQRHTLEIDHARLIRDYYAPFMPLLEGARKSEETDVVIWKSEEFDIALAVHAPLYQRLMREDYDGVISILSEEAPWRTDDPALSGDGIQVIAGARWHGMISSGPSERRFDG